MSEVAGGARQSLRNGALPLIHYGHHEGTTGSHFGEAAERLELGTVLRSAHRSHLRLAGTDSPLYLWIESGVTTLPIDTHQAPCLTAGYLIDVHLHLAQSLRQAALFDVVFIAQRDFVDAFDRIHPQVHWLPLAAPSSFLSIPRQALYQASFVGNLWPSTPRRAIMEEVSKRLTTNDWGRHWNVGEMAQIYAASQVVVNPVVRGDLNMRFFEALACGAAVVMPEVGNGVGDIAVEGRDYFIGDFSGSAASVADRVEQVVAGGCSGECGRALVADGHTYDHRLHQVLIECGEAEQMAPIRSMDVEMRAALFCDLADDYEDLGLLRLALGTSRKGVLAARLPWRSTAARGIWKWTKERIKGRTPGLAAQLRQWRPVVEKHR